MFSVVVNTGNPSASAFQSYIQSNGWTCPGVADGGKIASAVGGGGGNYHAIIYPDKRYERVLSDIVGGLGLKKHQCGGTTEFSLTVNSGSGDGDHEEGATVTIKADNAPSGKVFDKWTGDTQYLDDPNSATTTITMPEKDITVTATYKDIIVITYSLTVNSGSGDGEHGEDASVTIKADAAPTGQVFDKWTGDTQYITDPNKSTTTVTMPAKDITVTATYKELVKKDNYMVISTWEAGLDTLGSSVTIDSSAKADTSLSAMISLGTSNEAQKKWAWAQISGYASGDFSNVTSVELTYYSDNPMHLVLDQEGLSEGGASHYYELPAASRGSIAIPIGDFKQPSWVKTDAPDLVADLDLSKVGSISFAAVREGATTNLEIQGIYLEGYLETPIAIKNGLLHSSGVVTISNLSSNRLVLSNVTKGVYDVSIFNVAGKKLFSEQKSIEGISTMNFGTKRLTNGSYIVKINGNSGSIIKNCLVQ